MVGYALAAEVENGQVQRSHFPKVVVGWISIQVKSIRMETAREQNEKRKAMGAQRASGLLKSNEL